MTVQFYDPERLVREIEAHLQINGVDAMLQPGAAKDATVAAGALLRALGITPAIDGRDALARAMDKPWPVEES